MLDEKLGEKKGGGFKQFRGVSCGCQMMKLKVRLMNHARLSGRLHDLREGGGRSMQVGGRSLSGISQSGLQTCSSSCVHLRLQEGARTH